jgi:hypothetical protein
MPVTVCAMGFSDPFSSGNPDFPPDDGESFFDQPLLEPVSLLPGVDPSSLTTSPMCFFMVGICP